MSDKPTIILLNQTKNNDKGSAETAAIAGAKYADFLLNFNLFFYLHHSQLEEKYYSFKIGISVD